MQTFWFLIANPLHSDKNFRGLLQMFARMLESSCVTDTQEAMNRLAVPRPESTIKKEGKPQLSILTGRLYGESSRVPHIDNEASILHVFVLDGKPIIPKSIRIYQIHVFSNFIHSVNNGRTTVQFLFRLQLRPKVFVSWWNTAQTLTALEQFEIHKY